MALHIDANGNIWEGGTTVIVEGSADSLYLSAATVTLVRCAMQHGKRIQAVKFLRETFRSLSLKQCLRLAEYLHGS